LKMKVMFIPAMYGTLCKRYTHHTVIPQMVCRKWQERLTAGMQAR
jgi:hypothetical protein